jgi:hypothetical protein
MKRSVPPIIHVVNLFALLLSGLILLLAAVTSVPNVVLLLPIPVLIGIYWRFRANPNVAAVYLGLSMAVLFWILICENVVAIDNLLGSRITKQLTLGARLQVYADTKLKTPQRNFYVQPCCDDPLSWHYRPGSMVRHTFDCETCNLPYEVVADETGYLNASLGLMANHNQIDMFVAGDSVLQGVGVPSVMEFLRDQLPVTLWNLSISGYGPRQKINALITYALPKRPKWLVVEFYANNDVYEAIAADVCEGIQDSRYCFGTIEPSYRIVRHPVYHSMTDASADIFETFAYYAAQNFTLTTTRYVIERLKGTLERRLALGTRRLGLANSEKDNLKRQPIRGKSHFSSKINLSDQHDLIDRQVMFLSVTKHFRIRHEKLLDWVIAGMPLVHKNYERLVTKVSGMDSKPRVILLYHPTPYELYRDILTDRNADYDRIAEFQRNTQRVFAQKHGWMFLDLTIPLRHKLQASKMWLYGRYDLWHWSLEGTTVVAPVLGAELFKVIEGG